MPKKKFTKKEQLFIVEYFKQNFNGTEAAARAGYKGSRVTLASVAYENLRKPHIAAEVKRLMDDKVMGADEVLVRTSQIARNDVTEYIKQYGGLVFVDLEEVRQAGLLHLIQEVSNSRDGPRIKFTDSQRALETLAKIQNLYTEKPIAEINVHITDSRERLARLIADRAPGIRPNCDPERTH